MNSIVHVLEKSAFIPIRIDDVRISSVRHGPVEKPVKLFQMVLAEKNWRLRTEENVTLFRSSLIQHVPGDVFVVFDWWHIEDHSICLKNEFVIILT